MYMMLIYFNKKGTSHMNLIIVHCTLLNNDKLNLVIIFIFII